MQLNPGRLCWKGEHQIFVVKITPSEVKHYKHNLKFNLNDNDKYEKVRKLTQSFKIISWIKFVFEWINSIISFVSCFCIIHNTVSYIFMLPTLSRVTYGEHFVRCLWGCPILKTNLCMMCIVYYFCTTEPGVTGVSRITRGHTRYRGCPIL